MLMISVSGSVFFIVRSSLSAPVLIMLLLKAGMELDVVQLRETGARALAIGVTGMVCPLLVGMGLGMVSGQAHSMKAALAVDATRSS